MYVKPRHCQINSNGVTNVNFKLCPKFPINWANIVKKWLEDVFKNFTNKKVFSNNVSSFILENIFVKF